MKEQFPTLRNAQPWRDKDREDIETLRSLIRGLPENGQGSAGALVLLGLLRLG